MRCEYRGRATYRTKQLHAGYKNGSSHARWYVYAHAFEMNYARTHTHATRMRLTGNVLGECGKMAFFPKKPTKKSQVYFFGKVSKTSANRRCNKNLDEARERFITNKRRSDLDDRILTIGSKKLKNFQSTH